MDWMIQGSYPGKDKRLFSSPKCPAQLWGPPSLLFNGYWGSFLAVNLQLELRSRMSEVISLHPHYVLMAWTAKFTLPGTGIGYSV
jgi:hypothetical protein